MCDEPDLDIDSLQNEHESPTEWNLRRKFLLAHKNNLPLDSLLCMASVFINVEMSGCRYPPAVMERVRALSEAVRDDVESHRGDVKARTAVKFVKASDSEEPGPSKMGGAGTSSSFVPANTSHGGRKRAGLGSSNSAPAKRSGGGISFVKSNDGFRTTSETNVTNSPRKQELSIDPKFLNYQKHLKEYLVNAGTMDAMSLLAMAANKAPMSINVTFSTRIDGKFIAKILLDFVLVAEEVALNKKNAKREASESAVGLLCKNNLRIVTIGPDEFMFEGSDEPFESNSEFEEDFTTEPPHDYEQVPMQQFNQFKGNVRRQQQTKRRETFHRPHVPDFVLYENENGKNQHITILRTSGSLCNVPVTVEGLEWNKCLVKVGDLFSGVKTASSFKEARKEAAMAAVNDLRKRCYTISVKKRSDEDGVSLSDNQGTDNMALPDSNVGNKLLKMMGWSGGGIGKDGQGIAEPVSLDAVINREGLGLGTETGITPAFRQKVRHILEDYIQSSDRKDLVFSSELSNEQRKVIHQAGQKLHMKTRSYNRTRGERYIVVARKMGWKEVFQNLVLSGSSENEKYRLIAPGTHEDIDNMDSE